MKLVFLLSSQTSYSCSYCIRDGADAGEYLHETARCFILFFLFEATYMRQTYSLKKCKQETYKIKKVILKCMYENCK